MVTDATGGFVDDHVTRDFIRELLALKLIEPIDISLAFDDGQKIQLDGLYTVSRDALYPCMAHTQLSSP